MAAEADPAPAENAAVAKADHSALLKEQLLQQQEAFEANKAEIQEDAKAKAEADMCKHMLLQHKEENHSAVHQAREDAKAETEATLYKDFYEQSRKDAMARESEMRGSRSGTCRGEDRDVGAPTYVDRRYYQHYRRHCWTKSTPRLQLSAKPMDFNEAFQVSAAKLEEASEMKRTAKLLPEGSASQSALL